MYQYWIHADWIPKLGPIEYIMNTPSHHRVISSPSFPYLLSGSRNSILTVFTKETEKKKKKKKKTNTKTKTKTKF